MQFSSRVHFCKIQLFLLKPTTVDALSIKPYRGIMCKNYYLLFMMAWILMLAWIISSFLLTKKKNEVMSREILQTVVKNVALLCICIMHKGKIDVCDKYYVCIVNNKYTFLFFLAQFERVDLRVKIY